MRQSAMTKPLMAAAIWMATCASSLTASPPVEAIFFLRDGNSLLKACETALKPSSAMTTAQLMSGQHLMGYLDGFVRGMAACGGYHGELRPARGNFDVPVNVTMEQKLRVIRKWLEDHPNQLNEDADSLIFLSLREAFPVKQP